MLRLGERWRYFWFEPVSSANLGFCRVLFFGALFLLYLPQDFAAWAEVSNFYWNPIWLFNLLNLPVLSGDLLVIIQVIWKVALGLSCIGLFTRLSTAVSFILGVYLLGLPHNFGKTHHFDAILVFVLGIMALSRCGDSWSVDRLICVAREQFTSRAPHMSGEYTWPVRTVWLVMALIFLGAGISKVRYSGIEWISGESMAIALVRQYYHISNGEPLTSWGLIVAQYGWLCWLLAAATIICEAGYPLALFSRIARWIVVPGMFSITVGIRLLMGPTFEQFLICSLFWVPWDRVGLRLAAWLQSERTHALLFDGGCGFCQRTIAIIRNLDLLHRVKFFDALNSWPEIETQFPRLNQDTCLAEMHLITADRQIFTAFDAYRRLAWVLPLGWLGLPFLYMPGVHSVGCRIYMSVASRRHHRGCLLPPTR
jgi:predicted DCC family thiol-disulfide oxidoreductase YuxK